MKNQQVPEALRLAGAVDHWARGDYGLRGDEMRKAAAEIRRLHYENEHLAALVEAHQHARIVELEAQLEAIGAGGVSGPLMGQPQAMPDLTALTERGAKAWAGVDAQGLRDGVASAGSEPVAWLVCTEEGDPDMVFLSQHEAQEYLEDDERPTPLYTHPSPPGGMVATDAMIDAGKKMLHNSNGRGAREKVERIFNAMIALAAPPTAQAEGWISVDERLPEPDGPVLAHNGEWTGVAAWMSGEYLEPLERWQDEHREFVEMMGPAITHWMKLPESPYGKN